jgi:hypothetical protein
VAEALVRVARRRATERLPGPGDVEYRDAGTYGGGVHSVFADDVGPSEPDEAPRLGPVLHSRIMSALESWEVPTPSSGPGGPAHMAHREAQGRRVVLRLGVVALVVVGLVVGALALTSGDDDDGIGGGVVTDGRTDDQDGRDGRSDEDEASDEDEVAAATTVTTAAETTTTTVGDEDDDEGSGGPATTATTTPATAATTTTTTPPTTAPTTTTTTTPPEPEINEFGGTMTGNWCGNGDREVVLWWDTEYATTVRLRPRGGNNVTVSADGSYTGCADPGTDWILNASNSTGTTTAQVEV